MADVNIRRWSGGFSVNILETGLRKRISDYNEQLIQMKLESTRQGKRLVPGDEFFAKSQHFSAFYYNDSHYEPLLGFLKDVRDEGRYGRFEIAIENIQPHIGADVKIEKHTLLMEEPEESQWFFQNDMVDYASDPDKSHVVFQVQTGKGKTKCALKTVVRRRKRMMLITKSSFLDKWSGDITTNLKLRPGEFYRVKSGAELEGLIDMAKDGKLDGRNGAKMIAISSHLIEGYINDYLASGGPVAPWELLKVLGVGGIVYDESHMLFRMNYWSAMFLNPAYILDLTATIIPSNEFEEARFAERFPMEARYDKLAYEPISDVYAIYYGMRDHKKASRINRMRMYNHTEFEKILFKGTKETQDYYELIDSIMQPWYFKDRLDGMKCLVFFGLVESCKDFAKWLDRKYPKLKVRTYNAGDNYDAAIKADVIVSTTGKAGTAIDIPGLLLTVLTVPVDKKSTNLQILGRGRKDQIWGRTPVMAYLVCRNISKHVHYHRQRMSLFKGCVKKHIVLNSSRMV